MDSLHLQSLVETVNILGGTNLDAFRFVILPNLKKGITSSGILSLAILLGEFMFANLLIGGRYETLQIYLNSMKGKSGHFTSAMVSLFFVFIFVITYIAINLEKIVKKKEGNQKKREEVNYGVCRDKKFSKKIWRYTGFKKYKYKY